VENRVTISLDFELGWGAIETGMWRHRQSLGVYTGLRQRMASFVAFLEARELAVTFAMVGAANQNPGTQNFDYLPDDARAAAEKFVREADPKTQDGRDLLDQLLGMRTAQDIGSHSYSHTRFNWRGFSAEAKEEDVKRSCEALAQSGVNTQSFVYPLNIIDNHTILERAGIEIARLPPPMARSKMGKLQERLSGAPPAANHAPFSNSLTLETGSLLYVWGVKRDWRIRRWMTLRQANQALKRASRNQGNMHIWLHPFNLVEVPELYDDLIQFLETATGLRDAGLISLVPMSALTR